jgi:HlyD family secretion protein
MNRLVPALCLLIAACNGNDAGLPLVGTLERDRIEVVAEAHESIAALEVSEGDTVQAGDVLARQDDTRLRAQVARAQAGLDRSRARLDELLRGPRREAIDEARARLEGATARQATDEREYTRVADLVERGLVSRSQLDEALARRDRSRAERSEAAAQLAALLEGTTVEELEQARASVAEAEATLADASIAHARLTLRAPRDGRVDALPYKLGDRPQAGATVVVLLAAQAPYARIHVPEPLRARITPGVAAVVHVDGVSGSFDGEVRSVSSDPDFTPYFALTERDRGRLSFAAEVTLTGEPALELPAGLPVQVDFPGLRGD